MAYQNQKRKIIKKRKTSKLKKIFIGGLFFVVLCALIYLFLFSGFFTIKKVTVDLNNAEYVNIEDAKKIAFNNFNNHFLYNLPLIGSLFPSGNIFLVSENIIENDILKNFSEIKSIEVTKSLFERKIKIKIIEREKFAIWCNAEYLEVEKDNFITTTSTVENKDITIASSTEKDTVERKKATTTETDFSRKKKVNRCYYLSKEGVIYRKSPHLKGGLVVNLYSSQKANLKDQVFSSEIIDFIISLKEEFEIIKPISFDLFSKENLRVKTSKGIYINFNPTYPLESQIKNLRLLLNKEIKDLSEIDYIDLRVEGRAYYK